jgi:hypothetical protein
MFESLRRMIAGTFWNDISAQEELMIKQAGGAGCEILLLLRGRLRASLRRVGELMHKKYASAPLI